MQTPYPMRNKSSSRGHPLHYIWNSMIIRCYRPSHSKYKDYGGRGIRIYKAWFDFEFFSSDIQWHIGPRPSLGYSLDRINPNGNYTPRNVRWATRSEQERNKRNKK